MSAISTWSTTAASNNSASPNGFPENMPASGLNDSAREMMAALRTQHEQACWIDHGHTPTRTGNTTFTVTGNREAIYKTGRRIRCTDSSTLYGEIVSGTYSSVTTVEVLLDSGALSASLSAVAVGILDENYEAVTKAGTQNLTNKTLTSPVINTGVSGTAVLDDDTMATATDTTLATSESIKAYIDAAKAEAIPEGTSMVFYKMNPPSGWTEETIQANSALRVVAIGGTGGSYDGTSDFGTGVPDHTHTGPSHTHTLARDGWGSEVTGNLGTIGSAQSGVVRDIGTAAMTTSGSGTGNTGSAGAWVPKYMDVIVATKDAY